MKSYVIMYNVQSFRLPKFITLSFLFAFTIIYDYSYAQAFFKANLGATATGFVDASAVASDVNGNIYAIANYLNGTIYKFNSKGLFLLGWGGFGSSTGQFRSGGIAVDLAGNIFVTDYLNHRVLKFNGTGSLIKEWGSFGSGNGQFNYPKGIALDGSGDVYVVDNNDRTQKFNNNGSFITKWGSTGNGDGQFLSPSDVAIDGSGNVYVVDGGNNRIQKFSSSGSYITKWGSSGSGDGQFQGSDGIAVDGSGNVYVADRLNHRIQKFTGAGEFILKWGDNSTLSNPQSICAGPTGDLFVADYGYQGIKKFNATGGLLASWGSFGNQDGQFNNPEGIDFDAFGNVYVVDSFNNRIQKFSSTGQFLINWGAAGTGNGQFSTPADVAIDNSGNVYVVDKGNSRVQKFNSSGTFVTAWGSNGTANGQFQIPQGIAVDGSGNVYVADNSRIQKFNNTGTFITKWGTFGTGDGQFDSPTGISIDASGNIYVADTDNHRIQKFNSTGIFLTKWGSEGSGNGQFSYPADIAVDGEGDVFVVDDNHRVQKFDNTGTFIFKWGVQGFNAGQFYFPSSIGINNAGNIYVANTFGDKVDIFDFLTFSSFSPTSASPGSSITITGTGFSTPLTNQTVKFNGVTATVTGATETSLTVTVPNGISTGKISVTRETITLTSAKAFVVLPFQISSVAPGSGSSEQTVIISGTGFSSVPGNNTVKFNGTTAVVAASSPTSITAKIPTGATTGKISVTIEGITATSTTDFTVVPLGIIASNFPNFFNEGNSSVIASITVNDRDEIASGFIKSRGITQAESELKSTAFNIPAIGNIISYPIPASFFSDPLGLVYEFVLVNKQGDEVESEKGYTHIRYGNNSAGNIIPNLTFGKSVKNYQLIAIPLELTNGSVTTVFEDMGVYKNTDWRLYAFQNGKNVEYPAFNNIELGNGYWFIAAKEQTINVGAGNTFAATENIPFTKVLSEGWNLVGNPYNFTISWNDVLQQNNNPAGVSSLKQYLDGAFVDNPVLAPFRAGFVQSSTAVSLKIPVINRNGGRVAVKTDNSRIDKPNWLVNLSVDDGIIRNELFGLGMQTTALEGKDIFDEMTLPVLGELNAFEMKFQKDNELTFAKDVVTSAENYTWVADLSTSNTATLSWDNSSFGDSDKQLVIEVMGRVDITNMRKTDQLTLESGHHRLKFHFGSKSYIDEQVTGKELRLGSIAPNPFFKTSERLKIWANFSKPTIVALNLMDGMGRLLHSGKPLTVDKGRHELEWLIDFSGLSSGVYYALIEAKDEDGIQRYFRRLIIQ